MPTRWLLKDQKNTLHKSITVKKKNVQWKLMLVSVRLRNNCVSTRNNAVYSWEVLATSPPLVFRFFTSQMGLLQGPVQWTIRPWAWWAFILDFIPCRASYGILINSGKRSVGSMWVLKRGELWKVTLTTLYYSGNKWYLYDTCKF